MIDHRTYSSISQSGAIAVVVDIKDSGSDLNPITSSTGTTDPADGKFALFLGDFDSSGNFTIVNPAATNDLLIVWDESAGGNNNFGYVIEDLANYNSFTIEGQTYTYVDGQIRSGVVLPS